MFQPKYSSQESNSFSCTLDMVRYLPLDKIISFVLGNLPIMLVFPDLGSRGDTLFFSSISVIALLSPIDKKSSIFNLFTYVL